MAGGGFISADISKIADFERKSADAIREYDAIKEKFNEINATLLGKWQGMGADAYNTESSHILENIGGIGDILDGINNSAVKDIREVYNDLDEQLGEFNRNPSSE